MLTLYIQKSTFSSWKSSGLGTIQLSMHGIILRDLKTKEVFV